MYFAVIFQPQAEIISIAVLRGKLFLFKETAKVSADYLAVCF